MIFCVTKPAPTEYCRQRILAPPDRCATAQAEKPPMSDNPSRSRDAIAPLPRRTFLKGVLAGGSLLAAGGTLSGAESTSRTSGLSKPDFRGPNVILIRFGGGAR